MTDAAARRRELRRQRILANSDNRMKKILGDEAEPQIEQIPERDQLTEADISPEMIPSAEEHAEDPDLPPYPNLPSSKPIDPASFSNDMQSNPLADLLMQSGSGGNQPAKSGPVFWRYHFPCLMLGIVIRLVAEHYSLEAPPVTFLFIFLFSSFLIDLKSGQGQNHSLGYLALGLQLFGMRPQTVSRLATITTWIRRITNSVGLFFFTFIVTHFVLLNK